MVKRDRGPSKFPLAYDKAPPKRKGGKGNIRHQSDKDNRALLFLIEKAQGTSIKEIARRYQCSTLTVETSLTYGRKQDLLVSKAQELIVQSLLPMALAVYETHLSAASFEAAQDILYGIGALSKTSNVKHEASDPLDSFRATYFAATPAAPVALLEAASPVGGPQGPLVGEVVPQGNLVSPAALLSDSQLPLFPYEPEHLSERRQSDLHDQGEQDGE